MIKLYNTFYNLGVVNKIEDLVGLPQETILDKFSIFYGNDISELDEGSVMMVTDLNLKTLGFFRKYKDENEFNIDCNAVFFDVTSHTGLDFDLDGYFKEEGKKHPKELLNDKHLGFSGAIKRAQERNNAKKENSVKNKDTFCGVIGESKIKNKLKDKEDAVNQPSHYTSGDIEVITYIEQQAKVMYESGTVPPEVIPHICNAIKYISRFQSKGKPVEDLNKSIYYINRAIKNIEDSKE